MRFFRHQPEPRDETNVETFDPVRRARIDELVSKTERTLDVSGRVRHAQDMTTTSLVLARERATGIIGADLLADREGRMSGPPP